MKNVAEKCLEITDLFEAEVLIWLMLEAFKHPFVTDKDFANNLLEDASSALQLAISGEQLIEGVPATNLNFIAAIWYVENRALELPESDPATIQERKAWLSAVRRKWPSCFCDPSDLHQI